MADIIISGTGDGEVLRAKKVGQESWSTMRGATNGTSVDDTGSTMQLLNARSAGFKGRPDNRWLSRLFLPFNTGAIIPAGAIIDGCTFSIYVSSNSTTGSNIVYVTQGTQPDETNLTLSSYSKKGSGELVGGNISTNNGWRNSVFNEAGLGIVKRNGEASSGGGSAGWTKLCLRGWYDYKNNAPTKASISNAHYRTSTGVNPPRLTILWSPPAAVIFLKGGFLDIKGETLDLKA